MITAEQTSRDAAARTTLALRSRVTPERTVEVSLDEVEVREPGPDQVVVRIEAAAINPADVNLLFAGADVEQAERHSVDGRTVLVAPLSEAAVRGTASRTGLSLPAGTEGAGTVVAAGSSAPAQALLGKLVGVVPGGTYTGLRVSDASACLPFGDGTSALDGAGWFVNPMTASAMLVTMRQEGHRALVHTAATSSLGRMLQRLCIADGVPLVNIVRRPEQARELAELGAEHVCDTSSEHFPTELEEAIASTGATLAFDAVSGGPLAGQILAAMERVLTRDEPLRPYGSQVYKQVYLYGLLNPGATDLTWSGYGTSWGVGGWNIVARLQSLDPETLARVRSRVASELHTTFATRFADTLTLEQALDPDLVRSYSRLGTNAKYAITPA
jgi:NADPH:quinone reductase